MITHQVHRLPDGTTLRLWLVARRASLTVGSDTVVALVYALGLVWGVALGAPEWPSAERSATRLRLVLGPVALSVWRGNVSAGGALERLLRRLLLSPPPALRLRWPLAPRRAARRQRRGPAPLPLPQRSIP